MQISIDTRCAQQKECTYHHFSWCKRAGAQYHAHYQVTLCCLAIGHHFTYNTTYDSPLSIPFAFSTRMLNFDCKSFKLAVK